MICTPSRVHGAVTIGVRCIRGNPALLASIPTRLLIPTHPLLMFPARSAIPSARGPVVTPAALSEGTATLRPWEHAAWSSVHPAPDWYPPACFFIPPFLPAPHPSQSASTGTQLWTPVDQRPQSWLLQWSGFIPIWSASRGIVCIPLGENFSFSLR